MCHPNAMAACMLDLRNDFQPPGTLRAAVTCTAVPSPHAHAHLQRPDCALPLHRTPTRQRPACALTATSRHQVTRGPHSTPPSSKPAQSAGHGHSSATVREVRSGDNAPRPIVLPSEAPRTAQGSHRTSRPRPEHGAAAGSSQQTPAARPATAPGVLPLSLFPARGPCAAPEEPRAPAAGRGGSAVRAEPGRPGPEPDPRPAVPNCHQRADRAGPHPRLSPTSPHGPGGTDRAPA